MPAALATPNLRFRPLASRLRVVQLRRLFREVVLILAGTIFFFGLAGTIGLRGKPPAAEAITNEVQFSPPTIHVVQNSHAEFRDRDQD